MIEINKIKSPFIYYCQKVIPLAFDESLSYYEVLCHLTAKIKEVIDEQNIEGQAIQELQQKYLLLVDYVDNYFDNLDVQEEINNKLDEMADDGTLENLIGQYIALSTTYVYNTIADLKNATNLIEGSYARTSGFYEYNDHGGAYYKVRELTNDDVIDNIHLFTLDNTVNLIAELVNDNDYINCKQLGIDEEENASDIIQYAIDNYKKIYIPHGTYNVNKTLTAKNNIEIYGNNTILLMNNDSEDLKLLEINNKHNINIHDISFNNSASETGSSYSNDRIIVDINNSHNIYFNKFKMNNIYKDGIKVISSHNLNFKDCEFNNTGYSMLSLLTEVNNVIVDNCIFDTNTSTYTGGTYLFHTGSEDYSTPVDFFVKNILVQNSQFLNNPTWEGLECHGGENVKFINNYIYNCKIGIMARHDSRTPLTSTWHTKNITIKNNIIDGNSICTDGITAGGSTSDFAENFDINENEITNIKSGDSSVSVISFQYGKNFNINNNKISNFGYYGIRTYDCYYGNINGNYISDPNGRVDYGYYSNYSWLVNFKNNVIDGSPNISDGSKIAYGAGTANNSRGLIIIDNNHLIVDDSVGMNMRDNTRLNPTSNDSKRTGNISTNYKNVAGVIKAYFTNAKMRSVAGTVSSLPVTASANDKVITFTGTVYPIRYLAPGEEITITGAGDSGTDLTTTIKGFPALNKVELSNPILTSVTNADLKTLDSTMILL